MDRTFTLVIERDEDGLYFGSVPELPGCQTQGASVEQLRERIQEAIRAHLDAAGAAASGVEFIGVEKVRVSS